MANSILRILVWAGILIFVYGLFLQSFIGMGTGTPYIFVGILSLVVIFAIALAPDVLRKDHVIDRWSVLIEKANGKAGEVFTGTESFIKDSKAPAVKIAKRKVTTGFIAGVVGIEREFLVLTDKRSMSLQPYQVFINSRDYGENLDVSWYLTYRPTMGQVVVSLLAKAISYPKELGDLDVFDQQDLTAYVTNAHHCMLKAVEKIMLDSGQDPSKLDRKSRGFLGIS